MINEAFFIAHYSLIIVLLIAGQGRGLEMTPLLSARSSVHLRVNIFMNKRAAVGIDVGGTKTLALLVDEKFRTLADVKFKTRPDNGRNGFTRKLLAAVESLRKTARAKKFTIVGCGVGCAGLVDEEKLKIKTS